jgi:ABC-type multidrug transport system fused ATPase/permease subunit
MFAKLMRLPPAYFDDAATASLVTRFTNDVNNLAGASTTVLTVVVRDTVTIVALLAILLHSNWKLTLVTLPSCPWKVANSCPEVLSHRRAVLSSLAVSTRVPSGEKAAFQTLSSCPWKVANS